MARCASCGRELSRSARGRSPVYCSGACRQRAYRERREPAVDEVVPELIADIRQRAALLTPRWPEPLYTQVVGLSSAVGNLRRIARPAPGDDQAPRDQEPREPEPPTGTEGAGVVTGRLGDEQEFASLTEPLRRELHVHCYRMLGSYDDAEDLVQDTLLRAWRARDEFEGRSSLRAWLYKIATNACLDFLRRAKRQAQRYEPVPGMHHGDGESPPRVTWLQPYPDQLLDEVVSAEAGPEGTVLSRETMELIFVTATQHLPPRQRAVLIFRDVLGRSAAETARLLETSEASVNSALQRARSALREHLPPDRSQWARAARTTRQDQTVVRRYIMAAERADLGMMAELLAEDAVLTMPPNPFWFTGRDAILAFVAPSFDPASPAYLGRWRHLPTRANGRPALAGYVQRPGTTVYRAQNLDVLRTDGDRIVEITTFEPHLLAAFGLPMTVRHR